MNLSGLVKMTVDLDMPTFDNIIIEDDVPELPPPVKEVAPPAADKELPPPEKEVVNMEVTPPADEVCPPTPGSPPKSKKRRLEEDPILIGKDELDLDKLPKQLASRLATLMEFRMHSIIYGRPFGVSDALPHSDWDRCALNIFEEIDDVSELTFNTHCSIQQPNPSLIHCRSDVILECIQKRQKIETR